MKDRLIFENGWTIQREKEQELSKRMDRYKQESKIKTKKRCNQSTIKQIQ